MSLRIIMIYIVISYVLVSNLSIVIFFFMLLSIMLADYILKLNENKT